MAGASLSDRATEKIEDSGILYSEQPFSRSASENLHGEISSAAKAK